MHKGRQRTKEKKENKRKQSSKDVKAPHHRNSHDPQHLRDCVHRDDSVLELFFIFYLCMAWLLDARPPASISARCARYDGEHVGPRYGSRGLASRSMLRSLRSLRIEANQRTTGHANINGTTVNCKELPGSFKVCRTYLRHTERDSACICCVPRSGTAHQARKVTQSMQKMSIYN